MKSLKLASSLLLLASAAFFPHNASATDLTGDSVTGVIYVGSAFTVTQQFTSPATIGPGVEFTGGIQNTFFSTPFNVTADFGTDSLTVVFTSPNQSVIFDDPTYNAIVTLDFQGLGPGFQEFDGWAYACDPSLGMACNLATNGYFEGSFSPGTESFSFKSVHSGDTYTFSYLPTPSPTPEPSSIALLGTGLAATVTAGRRRLLTKRC